jgi:hypothetical protein
MRLRGARRRKKTLGFHVFLDEKIKTSSPSFYLIDLRGP